MEKEKLTKIIFIVSAILSAIIPFLTLISFVATVLKSGLPSFNMIITSALYCVLFGWPIIAAILYLFVNDKTVKGFAMFTLVLWWLTVLGFIFLATLVDYAPSISFK